MAIATVSGAISGLQYPQIFNKSSALNTSGLLTEFWASTGFPGAGAYDTTLNGVALVAPVAGQIPFTDPASGNTYLARLSCSAPAGGKLILCDRLWHNGGYDVTLTSAQLSTTPAWPARDAAGSANGDGVLLALVTSAVMGAATPTITVSYTNSSGVAGRTGTNILATQSASGAKIIYPIGLQAGDTGVQSVQSVTLNTSWISGTINLVAYRVLAEVEVRTGNASWAIDAVTGGFARMYNDSVPFFMWSPSQSGGVTLAGTLQYAQG